MSNLITEAQRAKQIFLKLKIAHIAQEPALIRRETRKSYRGTFRWRYRAALKELMTVHDLVAGRNKWDVLATADGRALFKTLRLKQPPEPFTGEPFLGMRLREHRLRDVRPEARAAQIAYAFIRGKSYAATESGAKTEPNWKRAGEIALKYGDFPQGTTKDEARQALLRWREQSLEVKEDKAA